MEVNKKINMWMGLVLLVIMASITATAVFSNSLLDNIILSYINQFGIADLKEIYFFPILIGILIYEFYSLNKVSDQVSFSWREFLKKEPNSFQQFSINHIGKARVGIVSSLLIFLFVVNDAEVLSNNIYLTINVFYYFASFMLVLSVIIVLTTSFKTEQGSSVTIGNPWHLTESITLITVPLIFMLSHKNPYITLFSIYAIVVGIFYHAIWFVHSFRQKKKIDGFIKQGISALLITSTSYYIIPIINSLSNDITMTVKHILDDSGYKQKYNATTINVKNIDKNLKIIQNNFTKFSNNMDHVKEDLDKCSWYTSKLQIDIKNNFYHPSSDNEKTYSQLINDYELLKSSYSELHSSINLLNDKQAILSTKNALKEIDVSLKNLNELLKF